MAIVTTTPVSEPLNFGLLYYHARRRLRQQRARLQQLFNFAKESHAELLSASQSGAAIEAAYVPATDLERLTSARGALDIYAGAIILVFNDMLQTLLHGYGEVGGTGTPGSQHYGYTVIEIMRAAGNNYRHYEEWRRRASHPSTQQSRDVAVIAAVIFGPSWELPQTNPFPYALPWFVLRRNSVTGATGRLRRSVMDAMYAMVSALGITTDGYVLRAAEECEVD